MVWRKAAVSARKAEDHAERRRPVNQPRGLNRRESAPFDSARRCGLLLPLAHNAVVEKEDPLDIPLIRHRRVGFQQEIAHWRQTEIEPLHVAVTYDVLVGDPFATVQSGLGYLLITDDHLPEPLNPLLCFRPLSPSPEIRRALVPKRYAVFTKAADAFLQAAKSFTIQTEYPLIPLYKGITGLPQQTEECCPRPPCVRGAGRRSGLRGYLPFLPLLSPYFSSPSFPKKVQRKACRFTRQAFHGIRR